MVRVDLNVPVTAIQDLMMTRKMSAELGHHHTWIVMNDAKIRAILPTVDYLTKAGAKVVLCSHMGRPPKDLPEDERIRSKYSLHNTFYKLSHYLDNNLNFAEDCIGNDREQKMSQMRGGDILLLENTRFHSPEERTMILDLRTPLLLVLISLSWMPSLLVIGPMLRL